MKRTEKRKNKLSGRGIITIIVLIIICVAIVIFTGKKDVGTPGETTLPETYQEISEGIKVNTSTKIQETKTFEGYEISNMSLRENDGETFFSAKLKNTTNGPIGNESIYIVFKNHTGEELYKMEAYITEIQPGQSITINSQITIDVIQSYDIEIKKK